MCLPVEYLKLIVFRNTVGGFYYNSYWVNAIHTRRDRMTFSVPAPLMNFSR